MLIGTFKAVIAVIMLIGTFTAVIVNIQGSCCCKSAHRNIQSSCCCNNANFDGVQSFNKTWKTKIRHQIQKIPKHSFFSDLAES